MGNGIACGLLLAGLGLCLLAGCQGRSNPSSDAKAVGNDTPVGAQAASINWIMSWELGLEEAKAQKKPLMVNFFSTWCAACYLLDQVTYRDPRVVEKSSRFVCVRIDVDQRPELEGRFGVDSLPTVAFMTSEGKPAYGVVGYGKVTDFLDAMDEGLAKAS